MSAVRPETEYRSWTADGHALRIEFSPAVLEEICGTAVDGLLKIRRGGIEVGGVLFGTAEEDRVRILAYRPVPCEHAHGPSFVLSKNDQAFLARVLEGPEYEPALAGLTPVGWYHSHTRSEISLSDTDLELHNRYFPDPKQVALVIRPAHFGPARAGFFFRERDGRIESRRTYREISVPPRTSTAAVEPEPQPDRSAPNSGEARLPAVPREVPLPAADLPPSGVPAPSFASLQPRRSRKQIWTVAAVGLLAAVAAGIVAWPHLARHSAPLSLRVRDLDGTLLIEWRRRARPLEQAGAATLEIRDGAETSRLPLDAERLRSGSMIYRRVSDRVDVRLRVERAGTAPVEESVLFLGQPVQPSPRELEAMRQNVQLQQQIQQLRETVKRQQYVIRRLQRPAQR